MSAQSLQRPIGFTPREISSLVNREVVSQHAEEAAFLWTLRNRAVDEPHYSLKDLAGLDERVEAHLDGLRVSGDVGWEYCKANLANEGPGEAFALAVLVFGAGNRERMRDALNAACKVPKLLPGLVSALGWLDFSITAQWIRLLLEAKSSLHRAVGIAACAIHREDPGSVLSAAIVDHDPLLRARALRAAGETKRHDLEEEILARLQDEDENCRFWAAWSLTLLGRHEGLRELVRYAQANSLFQEPALRLCLRALTLSDSRQLVSLLTKNPAFSRMTIIGVGVVGDPVSIPWLIKKMEVPEFALIAGESFTMITGIDLSYHDLNQDPPSEVAPKDESADEVTPLDYDSNLAWPSAHLVEQWWTRNQSGFFVGTRYLGGNPISAQSAIEILVKGKQRLRIAAALELALLSQDYLLFNVRARGELQQRRLVEWTS